MLIPDFVKDIDTVLWYSHDHNFAWINFHGVHC